ncbi:NUDIX hydrolase [Microbacterium amylolyticum]|uniref:8-oxo-dGTP pyrophosphatase MutT (NUDIX family) n=1 Tax=Microbacterium amylolyticum TaxID=936337 RepID=A0ABS4ZLB5_9MICO|nr:NUDIX domain-containing protein [Microbacterium amylolyticum]MBP2437745.1 8-oxo-dGTP pyrophosphatase MutT (NUDIX family) [Microbacterium amylolyticum]
MIDHDTKRVHVTAVVLRHADSGHILTVRKRGTSMFMQPGGKPEPGESAVDAGIREIREEIGVNLDPTQMRLLGVFSAPAANEPGYTVHSTVFTHPPVQGIAPAAEIEEVRWVDENQPLTDDLAPLMVTRILPALRTQG